MGLYNGEKPIVQLWCCHDLHTAEEEFVFKRTAIAYVVYSIQTGVRLIEFIAYKETAPFRNIINIFACIINILVPHEVKINMLLKETVNTTKVLAHICQSTKNT